MSDGVLERFTLILMSIGIFLLPLQIWPPMPLYGMQLSDVFFALAFIQFVIFHRDLPAKSVALPLVLFAMAACISALLNGLNPKLLGHFELVALCWIAACSSVYGSFFLRRALVISSAIAAFFAVTGVAMFYLGLDTQLLNIHGDLVADNYPRARGTMVRANMMASLVAMGLLLLWFERNLIPLKWVRHVIYALGLIALLFSFSRTILPFGLALMGGEIYRRRYPPSIWFLWGAAALAVAVTLWISIRHHIVLNPLTPFDFEVLAKSGTRYAIWNDAWVTIKEHPLFGIGPGKEVAKGWSAHNTWLNLWAGLGIGGLLAFGFLLGLSISSVVRAAIIGMTAVLFVFLTDSFYTDIEDMRHVWIVMGIALSTLSDKTHNSSSGEASTPATAIN